VKKNTYEIHEEHRELSLEELDVLCRKCHHMHDEEILRMLSRFFAKLAAFFDREDQHPCHSSAR